MHLVSFLVFIVKRDSRERHFSRLRFRFAFSGPTDLLKVLLSSKSYLVC